MTTGTPDRGRRSHLAWWAFALLGAVVAAGLARYAEPRLVAAMGLRPEGWPAVAVGTAIYVVIGLSYAGAWDEAARTYRRRREAGRVRGRVAARLEVLRGLPANWDAYGADPPDPAALADAETLLDRLAGSAPRLPAPRINATRGGRVQIDWEREGRSFEVTALGGGEVGLFFEDRDARQDREWDVPLDSALPEVLEYCARVVDRP